MAIINGFGINIIGTKYSAITNNFY